MILSTASKKSKAKSVAGATAAVAFSFALVSCGSDAETTGGGLSTAATAPGEATIANGASDVTGAADGALTTPAEPVEPGQKAEGDAAQVEKPAANPAEPAPNGQQGNGQPAPSLINPLENGLDVPTYEPVSGGREGTAAERREIEDVVRKVTNPESFAKWTRVILDNSCAAVREPAMEEFEKQGLTLEMVEQIMAEQEKQGQAIDIPSTEISISDVRVNGDRASATVTSTARGETASNVQLFAKEDGRWKVCNS